MDFQCQQLLLEIWSIIMSLHERAIRALLDPKGLGVSMAGNTSACLVASSISPTITELYVATIIKTTAVMHVPCGTLCVYIPTYHCIRALSTIIDIVSTR